MVINGANSNCMVDDAWVESWKLSGSGYLALQAAGAGSIMWVSSLRYGTGGGSAPFTGGAGTIYLDN